MAHGGLLRASAIKKEANERQVLTGNDTQLGTLPKCTCLGGEWNASLDWVLSWKGFLKDLFCLALICLQLRNANNKPEVESYSLYNLLGYPSVRLVVNHWAETVFFPNQFTVNFSSLGSRIIMWRYPTGHASRHKVCMVFSIIYVLLEYLFLYIYFQVDVTQELKSYSLSLSGGNLIFYPY